MKKDKKPRCLDGAESRETADWAADKNRRDRNQSAAVRGAKGLAARFAARRANKR